MKTLSREGIQRMVDGAGGSSVSGGGISSRDLAGLATQMWVNQNYLSIDFFSSLFKAYGPAETEGDPDVEIVPNDTESTISNIKAMFGFWTEQYISALGQGSGGGGGGASALTDLVDVAISNPTNGQVLKYNSTTGKWYNGTDEGVTSLAWSQITGKPTTLSGYGITDAKIVNGTITLGSNSITPLTSFTETDPTVPAWAKASTKPSYSFSELTSHPTTLGGYGITDARISSGTIYLGGNSITPLTSFTETDPTVPAWAKAATKPSYAFSELTSHPTTLSGYGITDAMSSGTTFWGQTVSNGVVNGIMTFTTLAMATNYTDVWNDGTNDHPWYGYDHRYQNTGVYSTTISDYFGLTFHTGQGWLSMTQDGRVGIGTTTPSVKLDVNGAVKATRFYLYKPNSDDTGAVYFQRDANGDVQLVGAGLWTNSFISALGQGSGGGGGGATALTDLTDVEFSGTPSNGQVLKYNGTTHKWYNGTDEGLTSLPWSQITGKPTTLSGYGITDAYTKTEADAKYLTSSSFSAFTASSLNISATIGTTTRTVQAPTIAYLGNNVEAASSDTTPSSKFVGTKFGASSGFYMTGVYPSESSPADIPCSYGNILNILGGGGGQLLAEWCGSYKTGHLYYRSHRDYLATGGWTPWEKIAFISDFSSWALAASKPSYAFSELTSHPTTLSGYGITDAKIVNGTITLGSNSITPLTSFTETDPTVPAWAKAATKPSYAFSELTGSVAFSQLPTMYWADQAVSSSSNNNTSPQFGNLRLRPGSGNYGSYLYFGDGNFAYLAELSDDHLTYRAGSHTFNVSSNEAVQINSSGLRIGGSSGVVLSYDSTNNALKVQKADGTAANLYATGGVSALGMSGGSGGSIGTLTVTSRLNIGNTDCNLQQDSGGDFHINCNNYLYLGSSLSYIDSDGWMTATGLHAKVNKSTYFLATEDGIDFFSSAAGYHPIRIYYNGSWRTLNMQAAINAGLFS